VGRERSGRPLVPRAWEPAEFDGVVILGGVLVAEVRNALFGLFTLHQPSVLFMTNDRIDLVSLGSKATSSGALALESAQAVLTAHFRMDLQPIRSGKQGEP
jgi:hypothetical protein